MRREKWYACRYITSVSTVDRTAKLFVKNSESTYRYRSQSVRSCCSISVSTQKPRWLWSWKKRLLVSEMITICSVYGANFFPRCMECRSGLAMIILFVCPSVWLSVRPSVKRVICDQMEERSVQIFIPYERSLSLVFWEEEWLVGAIPATWNSGSTGPRWSDFQPIFARSSSAVTPSEKVQLTLIRSPLRAFQWI